MRKDKHYVLSLNTMNYLTQGCIILGVNVLCGSAERATMFRCGNKPYGHTLHRVNDEGWLSENENQLFLIANKKMGGEYFE